MLRIFWVFCALDKFSKYVYASKATIRFSYFSLMMVYGWKYETLLDI